METKTKIIVGGVIVGAIASIAYFGRKKEPALIEIIDNGSQAPSTPIQQGQFTPGEVYTPGGNVNWQEIYNTLNPQGLNPVLTPYN